MAQQVKIPCTIMRGGTSKGIFFLETDLPEAGVLRDQILLAAFGSPDPRQIDGLGGSYSVTSKAAIIGRSTRPDVDVNYTFGQISITSPLVDYGGNCGNVSSAVGPFAIDAGFVSISEPVTVVRILNTNTNKIIEAEVLVQDGYAAVNGDCQIAGVPGYGACIKMGFVEPGGSVTGKLLPTGNPSDLLDVPTLGTIEVSLVDAANPAVFVRAKDVGMQGSESAAEIGVQPSLLAKLEAIRSAAAVKLGFVDKFEQATDQSPSIPKIAVIAPSASYQQANGGTMCAESVDVVARIMSMQKAHRAYALTGAVATTAASVIPNTIVSEAAGKVTTHTFRLGHPAGTMTMEVAITQKGADIHIQKVVAERTARRLMDGYVYVPKRIFFNGETDATGE